jgi:TIR domain
VAKKSPIRSLGFSHRNKEAGRCGRERGQGRLEQVMGDIFISYAREDHQAAKRLAEALKSNGWSVWWDPDIPPGEIWDELIEQELANVSGVIVLWSATSIHKQWVKAEATEAQARGILVPAFIENVKPPLAFRQIQAAPLADWRGDRDHPGFQQLLGTIRRLVGSRPQHVCEPGFTAARGAALNNDGMRRVVAPGPSPKRTAGTGMRAGFSSVQAEISQRRRTPGD